SSTYAGRTCSIPSLRGAPARFQGVSPIASIHCISLGLRTDIPLIQFQNVSVARGERIALDRLTMSIGIGEHVAILGPNGCGKSTFIKTITRECYPQQREGSWLKILGEERWNIFELRSLLGIVSNDLMTACTRDFKAEEVVISGFFSSIGVWPHMSV